MNRQSSPTHQTLKLPTPGAAWQTCPTKPEIPAARRDKNAGRYSIIGDPSPSTVRSGSY